MFNFSKPFGNASLLLLVSAALHLVVIAVSMGGYVTPMIIGAVLWTACAYLLETGNRWVAGLVFVLTIFIAATIPLANALTETGLVSVVFYGIVLADLGAAIALFIALWRPKEAPSST